MPITSITRILTLPMAEGHIVLKLSWPVTNLLCPQYRTAFPHT